MACHAASQREKLLKNLVKQRRCPSCLWGRWEKLSERKEPLLADGEPRWIPCRKKQHPDLDEIYVRAEAPSEETVV